MTDGFDGLHSFTTPSSKGLHHQGNKRTFSRVADTGMGGLFPFFPNIKSMTLGDCCTLKSELQDWGYDSDIESCWSSMLPVGKIQAIKVRFATRN